MRQISKGILLNNELVYAMPRHTWTGNGTGNGMGERNGGNRLGNIKVIQYIKEQSIACQSIALDISFHQMASQ